MYLAEQVKSYGRRKGLVEPIGRELPINPHRCRTAWTYDSRAKTYPLKMKGQVDFIDDYVSSRSSLGLRNEPTQYKDDSVANRPKFVT